MLFKRPVEIGRVAYVAYGPAKLRGKLCTIVDVVDQNRVLVDSTGDVPRQALNLKWLMLTKFVLKGAQHGMRTGSVLRLWTEQKLDEQWSASSWAQKLRAKQLRAQMNDLDRFKLMLAKRARNRLVRDAATRVRVKFNKARKERLAASGGKSKPKEKKAKPAPAKAGAPAGKQQKQAKAGAPAGKQQKPAAKK